MAKAHRICAVEGCCKKIHAGGYCGAHYNRLIRHGDPLAGGRPREKRGLHCSVNGCDRSVYGRGLCAKHWQRWRKNGDPEIVGRTPKGTLDLWLKGHANHKGDDCLIWPFFRDATGYGNCHFSGQGMKASRAMCILAHGEPPAPEMDAAHSCGNGHLGCVHPEHLRWATKVQNCADMLAHGTRAMGEAVWNAKLTEADVRIIRGLVFHMSHSEIAKQFGVRRATIGDVICRRTWKHVA